MTGTRKVALSRGRRLGRYEVLAPLGAGGMGEVYRARDTQLERDVAVKVLPEAVADDPARLERFQREARAVARLSHPNILEIFDFGEHEGISYAVTELLEGDTLRELLTGVPLPWKRAREIAAAVADGLAAAHDKGVIHRDLKPENIFVTADGRVKVLDFGLARLEGPVASEGQTGTLTPGDTQRGVVLGTIGYMAPEQIKGHPADARSDIFALGCVLYEMLAGSRAFLRDSAVETMAAILKEDPPPFTASGVSLTPELTRTIERCLEKRPERRFQSAADLAFALRALTSDSDASRCLPALRTTSRPRWVAPVLAACLVVVAGLAMVVWRGARPSSAPQAAQPPSASRQSTAWIEGWRVAVAPFENRTGEPALDPLGRTIADLLTDGVARITQGAPSLPPVTVVAADARAGVPAPPEEEPPSGEGRLLVTGSYSPQAAALEAVAQVRDPLDGRVLFATTPLTVPRRPSADQLDPLLGLVQGAVAIHVAFGLENVSHVPDYALVREYLIGVEEVWSGNRSGWDRLERVLEADPEYLAPALWMAAGHLYRQHPEDAAPYIEHVRQRTSRLTRYERLYLDLLTAWVDNDSGRALQAARELQSGNPRDVLARIFRARFAEDLGNAEEVVETLDGVLDHIPRVYRFPRLLVLKSLMWSYQDLGRFDDSLALARGLRREAPGETQPFLYEATSLAALGRLDELEATVAECEATPGGRCDAGVVLAEAAWSLTAHGRKKEGLACGRRAVEAFRSRVERGAAGGLDSVGYLYALRAAEMWQEYADVARRLMTSEKLVPKTREYMPCCLGIALAHLGDRAAAEDIVATFIADDNYLYAGYVTAHLGQLERAMEYLKRSLTSPAGARYSQFRRFDLDTEPLWNYPPFQELLKKHG